MLKDWILGQFEIEKYLYDWMAGVVFPHQIFLIFAGPLKSLLLRYMAKNIQVT